MLTGELLLLPGGRRRHLLRKKQKNMRGRAPYFSISTSLESPNQYGIFFFGPNGLVKVCMEPVLKSSCPAYIFTTTRVQRAGGSGISVMWKDAHSRWRTSQQCVAWYICLGSGIGSFVAFYLSSPPYTGAFQPRRT
jgi:hypothetical protein